MKITFLGTGTSHGIPVIACPCEICHSTDPLDKRLRSSIMIEVDEQVLVIDTGPDFREQMLREHVTHVDAVLFTHEHKDHTAGFDDIRAFNFFQQKDMDVYATHRVIENLKRSFDYIFADHKYPGVPSVAVHEINNTPFHIGPTEIIPVQVMHLKLPVLGFRIRDFVYITDANFISEEEKEKIYGCKVLVLNALRVDKHISHFSLAEALDLADEFGAETTYFTHISHQLGMHAEVEKKFPSYIRLSYDGLKLEL